MAIAPTGAVRPTHSPSRPTPRPLVYGRAAHGGSARRLDSSGGPRNGPVKGVPALRRTELGNSVGKAGWLANRLSISWRSRRRLCNCQPVKMTLTEERPPSIVPAPLQASIAQGRNDNHGGKQSWDQSQRFAIPDPPAEREFTDEVGLVHDWQCWFAGRCGLREPAALCLLSARIYPARGRHSGAVPHDGCSAAVLRGAGSSGGASRAAGDPASDVRGASTDVRRPSTGLRGASTSLCAVRALPISQTLFA